MCCICEQLSIIPCLFCLLIVIQRAEMKRVFCVCFICRFDAVIISSEVGSEKPDANIFKAALGTYSTTIFSGFFF